MTDAELQQARVHKWRLAANPVRTLDDAREFIESVGFSLMYPLRPAVQLPTFVGAWVGADERLPTWQHAFSDPRAKDASELMVRLLRERGAYEANLVEENNNFLVAASVYPYFYALVGERNPKQPPKPGPRSEYSQLACDAFQIISKEGPISKPQLREKLGGELSLAALDRALVELWSRLRITRVDYKEGEGAYWDVLYRWAPEAVKEGAGLSVGVALSALISKYLDCMVAAEPAEVENFLSNIVPRSRVRESINALLAARELSFLHVGNRSLVQVTPAKEPSAPRAPKALPDPRKTPIGSRPR
jgi:Winged helix DNA-binding domain